MWLYGDYWRWGERPIIFRSHVPICQKDSSVNVTVQLTAREPLDYTVWRRIGWLLDTSPTSEINSFFFSLERPNGSTANGTQYNTQWQICIVTADSWLGHQNVSFKNEPSPPLEWGCGFVKTRGGQTFLITVQVAAAVDSSPLTGKHLAQECAHVLACDCC